MTRIISIQYLRALAALAVLVFHGMESTNHRFIVGSAGVDLFFIISGFVMGLLLMEPGAEPTSFLWRRFIRIAPFFWAATLLTLGCWMAKPDMIPWLHATPGDVLRTFLFIPYKAAHGEAPVLWQGWTLNYEAAFYVLCAVILLATPRDRLGIAFAILLAVGLARLVLEPKTVPAETLVNPLVLEFAMGIVLCVLWRRRLLPSARIGMGLLAAAGALFLVFQLNQRELEGYERVLLWGVPSFLAATGALTLDWRGQLPMIPGLATLGDASYAIYLLHELPLMASQHFITAALPATLRVPIAVVVAVLVGLSAHFWFERPLLAALRRVGAKVAAAVQATGQPPIANPAERL